MKKMLSVIGIVALTAAIFAVGYLLGQSSDFNEAMMLNDLFSEKVMEAGETIMLAEMLSGGQSEKAARLLNIKLNGQVFAISTLGPEIENTDNKIIAKKILKRIANYRNKFPRKDTDPDVDAMIDVILKNIENENSSK